jgi:hypothetical protein
MDEEPTAEARTIRIALELAVVPEAAEAGFGKELLIEVRGPRQTRRLHEPE